MARAFPVTSPTDYGTPSGGDWQALRGELVALLDQVEGQYAHSAAADPAFAGFAQRMRDLRYQVADARPDDRHREALRSVKRQMDRFTERSETDSVQHADTILQSAIQQIRSRQVGMGEMPMPHAAMQAAPPPPAPPRFDELARSMSGLSARLEQLEAELRAQRGNASQVREIADQVSQLSHVVELVAGAVGETGQVKRLEGQIAGLAQMIGQAPKVDLSQLTQRLDAVSATVDRLADLQVQQIQHVVLEAQQEPQKDAETVRAMRAIEASVRNVYDRMDGLESHVGLQSGERDRINEALAEISSRLVGDPRPERLLTLVDALNGRVNELEDRGDAFGGLRNDIEALRSAVLGAVEPRFAAIEATLGQLGGQLSERASDVPGLSQLEAQVRQLVARMDQTGEQLSDLARLYGSDSSKAPPDFESLANLAATRTFEAMSRQAPPPPVPAMPDFDALADLVAARTSAAMSRQMLPAPVHPDMDALAELVATRTSTAIGRNSAPPSVTEAGLGEIEARLTRLVEGIARTRAPDGLAGMRDGIDSMAERLQRIEMALGRREAPMPVAPLAAALPRSEPAMPIAALAAKPVAVAKPAAPASDDMPRSPAAEAPLKEFGFPDMGPVRAALEAKNGPRKLHPGMEKDLEADPRFETQPITPEMSGARAKPAATTAQPTPPAFDPSTVTRPPRPESALDAAPQTPFSPAAMPAEAPAPAVPEVPTSSRNTFIEAARRAAQRQTPVRSQSEVSSLIGRALSRFQPSGTAEKPAKPAAVATAFVAPPAPVAAPVIPLPPPPEPAVTDSPRKASRIGRLLARTPKPATIAPEPEPPQASVVETIIPEGAVERAEAGAQESFLLRHRRAILLGAGVVAVSFMAFNLIEQRLAANDAQPAATTPIAPTAAAPTAPANPAPTKPADVKPIGDIAPVTSEAAPATDVATASPAPRVIAMTDPMTTASIDPGPSMSFTPTDKASALPPTLASAGDTPAVATPVVQLASAPANAPLVMPTATGITPAAPADASSASAAPTDGSATPADPAAMESPVKVELPPDGLGPLDLRQAAANGDARAQFEIAAIYSEGRAVPQDFKLAATWYERAAAQGFGPAQYRLGNLYENGKGVDKDLDQARLWYQRSAEAGNRMAMHNLAALYASGQFGKQDFTSAADWFQRAADLGMKDSQFNLGMLYARGLGVTQSLATSYKWFALAAAGGDTEASKARDDIARSLDAATLKQAQADVAAWKLGAVDLAANFAPIGTWTKNFNPGPTVTTRDVVTKVQVALLRLGYDIGTPDGHAGPKTVTAIKAFEAGTGMSQVGAINPRLLAVLGSQPV